MSYNDLHSANSQNLDILGNIEILARVCPVKMARMVTLSQMCSFFHKLAEKGLPKKITGLIFFMFPVLVDAPGTRL